MQERLPNLRDGVPTWESISWRFIWVSVMPEKSMLSARIEMRSSYQTIPLTDPCLGGGQCQCSAEMFGLPFIHTHVHIVRDEDSDRVTRIRTPPPRQPGL